MTGFRPRIAPTADTPARRPSPGLIILLALSIIGLGWLLVRTPDRDVGREPMRPDSVPPVPVSAPAAGTARRPADLPPPEPYKPDPAGRAILDALKLAPARTASGAPGYVVTKSDAELLAGTPLREGDVLLELDGQKLDPARLERLSDELGDYDDVWVSFERDGKKVGALLELRRR